MRNEIFVFAAAILVLSVMYGCVDVSSFMGGGEEQQQQPTGGRVEYSKAVFGESMDVTELYPGQATTLLVTINNTWENPIKNVEIQLKGASFVVSSSVLDTMVSVDKKEATVNNVNSGAYSQRSFVIRVPRKLVERVNVYPRICFDYNQTIAKDIVLVPDSATQVTTPSHYTNEPLSVRIPTNKILATESIVGEGGTESYLSYTVGAQSVDSIENLYNFTFDISTDNYLGGINSISLAELSSDNGDFACEEYTFTDDQKRERCYLTKEYEPQIKTLSGSVAVSIDNPVESETYENVEIVAEGRYCVNLPTITINVKKV